MIRCIGVKELAYGIPRISTIFDFWKSFEFSPTALEDDKRGFFHCTELLSCQTLLAAAYFNLLAEYIGSPDLTLTAAQLERESVRLFPCVSSADIGTKSGARYRGRRLHVCSGSALELIPDGSDETVATELSGVNAHIDIDTVDRIYDFLRRRVDLEATLAALFSDIGTPLRRCCGAFIRCGNIDEKEFLQSLSFVDAFLVDLKKVIIDR